MNFDEMERRYYELRGKHAAGKLNTDEFQNAVAELTREDDQGRLWTIGVRTGNWYVARAGEWVQAHPGEPVQSIQTTPEQDQEASTREETETGATVTYVGVGRRALAAILDTIILGMMYVALSFVISAAGMGLSTSVAGNLSKGGGLVMYSVGCVGLFIGFVYFVALEAMFGSTIGKKILGMQVVKVDGTSCGWGAALVRNVIRIVDGLFLYLVGAVLIWTSDQKQRLGDRIANTVVVLTR